MVTTISAKAWWWEDGQQSNTKMWGEKWRKLDFVSIRNLCECSVKWSVIRSSALPTVNFFRQSIAFLNKEKWRYCVERDSVTPISCL
jgi:hypothetical protein